MFAIVTAAGKTKEEIIATLKESVLFLEKESANNFIGQDSEADIFNCDFTYMGDFLKLEVLEPTLLNYKGEL